MMSLGMLLARKYPASLIAVAFRLPSSAPLLRASDTQGSKLSLLTLLLDFCWQRATSQSGGRVGAVR